nr:MAG TPA: HEN1, small RNA methyltransferase, protein-RNA [Bacteriophage sp.]
MIVLEKILSYINHKRVPDSPKGIQYLVIVNNTYEYRKDAEQAMAELSLKSGIPLNRFKVVELWNEEALKEVAERNPGISASEQK